MTAYELRISDWISDVCSSDLGHYTLRASYAGAETKTTSVNVTETGTTKVGIALSANGDEEATILVIGQQASLGSSISRQRAADGVETVLTRDATNGRAASRERGCQ